ncbi:serine hydrolase [Aureibacter tunicatorum]|uniref:CubicO group peptidase (Beta-lactamase class C family) n=1 Tax=Aureibacter tunicatorum TaxID=866807 RepID=A0AAE3XP01_9BACT|nr:serine hydrolase [Aureibacter tunicatorum]MDR6240452.1 CubicO group peptidase (beta-lactamase class C family) [Aureibacter tunicatorum]BDD05669.1 hypothetical protein AUTU_31520 [Aureibacter tunicatorum]
MKNLILALTCFACFSCQSAKKNEENPFKVHAKLIDQYAESSLKKGNINSLAIAVYKEGMIYQNYYGEMDKGQNNQPNDKTLYEIASISKIFAGTLAAKAVLEGKFKLEDDIRMYLDGDYSNLEFEGTPVTIQNLLTHTIGFNNPDRLKEIFEKTNEGYYENKAFEYDMTDFLGELKSVNLHKKPGTHYQYNSSGPELVAYILSKTYERPYEDLLMDLFAEIGMNNSYLQNYDQHKQYLSNGYGEHHQVASIDKTPLLGGASGVISTLPDMIKFMKFQMESDNKYISESYRYLFQSEESNMGYLWEVGEGEKEGFFYAKTGTANGIQSGLFLCPTSNYAIVLIMNNNSEIAFNDWVNLYYKIENDLIDYPKINLVAYLEPELINNTEKAIIKYHKLKTDTANFVAGSSYYMNALGYDLIAQNKFDKAIEIFEFAVSENPEDANLFDSLGEAYFLAKDYRKSADNFKKSLELNPDNSNAEEYLEKISELRNKLN